MGFMKMNAAAKGQSSSWKS